MLDSYNPQKLINSLESFPHTDRVREMIKLGKKEAADRDISQLIDSLQQGNYYERMLALYYCYGSYKESRVLTALQDNSRSIKDKAIALIPLMVSDDEVLKAIDSLNYRQCRFLFDRLIKRKRQHLVDRCLEKIENRYQQRIEALLIYGTKEFVISNLDRILARAGFDEWTKLVKYHPDVTLDALKQYAKSSTGKDWQFVGTFNRVIDRLIELYPEGVLDLVKSLVGHPSFDALNFSRLIYYRPVEVAQLILQLEAKYKIYLNPIAHKLPQDILIELIDKQPQTVNNYRYWLPKLKPEQRQKICDRFNLKWRDSRGLLSTDLIELLPIATREKEARHSLNFPDFATRPKQCLAYAIFLPWNEVWQLIQPYLKNPDADLRILALQTIINTTKYHRSHLGELLGIIKQRKNEQDPVRNAIFYSLVGLPPSSWQAEHLPDIDTIFEDALQAADISQATRNHIQHLVIKILPFHPQWSAEWLAKFVEARGRINFYNLGSRLNDAQVRQLAPIVLPVFKSWETRESEWNIIEAAYSFGKRLKVFGSLVDILERVLDNTKDKWNAARILNILDQYRRDRLSYLIPLLLKKDPSWFTQSVVSNYLHNYQQDLLTPYLGQAAYKGRFATGKTYYVPYFYSGFSRWTFKQQNIYAKSLEALTRNGKRDVPTVWSAIERLACLPAIETPPRLIQLASIKNPQEAVRDRALQALANLDNGEGIPILLSALEDNRARIAIYTLRKSLLEMPVEDAVAILKNVKSEKVTVDKEIVRLLGDLDSGAAYEELLAKTSQDIHRDVRIASLRALWEHLEKPATWITLEQAARDADEAVATMAGRTPGYRLSEQGQTKLISLLVILLNRPEPTLRLTILQRCYQLPVRDREQILLPQLLKSLNSDYTDEVKAASNAIFTTYRDTKIIIETISYILPQRRNLNLILPSLQHRLSGYHKDENRLEMLEALLSLLAKDPITISWQIKIAVAALEGDKLIQFFQNINNRGELHPDALVVAENALSAAASHPDLEQIESTLAVSESEQLRRLALSALIAQKNRLGWNKARVERLLAYRQDKSILVAATAQFIFPPQPVDFLQKLSNE